MNDEYHNLISKIGYSSLISQSLSLKKTPLKESPKKKIYHEQEIFSKSQKSYFKKS